MTKKSKLALVAAVLAALICGSPVLAATTTYADNRAGFLAATGATTIGALPGLTSPTNVDGVTVGPITYKEVAGSNAVFFDYSNEISGSEIGISGVENFNMRVAAGVYSIGFAIHEPTYQGSNNYSSPGAWGCNAPCFDTTFSIEIFAGGASLGLFTYNAPDDIDFRASIGSAGFFGLHSSVAFDEVRVRDVTNTIDNEFFGDFFAGRDALGSPSIPEPSTGALMPLCLGLLGLAARRRRS